MCVGSFKYLIENLAYLFFPCLDGFFSVQVDRVVQIEKDIFALFLDFIKYFFHREVVRFDGEECFLRVCLCRQAETHTHPQKKQTNTKPCVIFHIACNDLSW